MTKMQAGEGRKPTTMPSLTHRHRQENAAIMKFVNISVFKSWCHHTDF